MRGPGDENEDYFHPDDQIPSRYILYFYTLLQKVHHFGILFQPSLDCEDDFPLKLLKRQSLPVLLRTTTFIEAGEETE